MGAFFLANKNKSYNLNAVLGIFKERDFNDPMKVCLGDYDILLYRKILTESYNYFSEGENIICAVGTYLYKDYPLKETLSELLKDVVNKKIDRRLLKGNYTIICYVNKKIVIIKDPENLYNIFHTEDMQVISSSFLGLVNSFNDKLHLNKDAIREVLMTGYIIGSDTLFKEIFRFEKQHLNNGKDISWIYDAPEITSKRGFNNETENQIAALDEYFEKVKNVFGSVNCSVGVTGGLDSRLLIGLIRKHFKNAIFFSHFRRESNLELDIANKIATKLDINLLSPRVEDANEMSEEQLTDQLEKAMFFLDGQIRSSTFWTEEYNSLKYFENFSSKAGLNFNGIGGEQYRNGERILFRKREIVAWHYYETAYKYLGELFSDTLKKKTFFEYMNAKTGAVFPIKKNQKASRLDVKRFLNEVFNPAGRCLRLSTENQACFALAPFTDYEISHKAYDIVPHLGLSSQFEIGLINKVIPELADVETVHGYKPEKGEPMRSKMLSVIKELMPSKMFYKILYKRRRFDNKSIELYKKHHKLEEYYKIIKNLDLGIDVHRIKFSASHNPHLISLGFFLNYFSYKISND